MFEVSEAVPAFLQCSTQGLHRAQTGAQVPWVVSGYGPGAHDAQRLHVECSRLQACLQGRGSILTGAAGVHKDSYGRRRRP
jgi:hypothetical protein